MAVNEARRRCPKFDAEVLAAGEEATDLLEATAVKRATEAKKPSDLLLIFLLRARRPATYRDNYRLEHTGPDGAPIQAAVASGAVILLPRDGFDEAARKYAEPTEPEAAGSP